MKHIFYFIIDKIAMHNEIVNSDEIIFNSINPFYLICTKNNGCLKVIEPTFNQIIIELKYREQDIFEYSNMKSSGENILFRFNLDKNIIEIFNSLNNIICLKGCIERSVGIFTKKPSYQSFIFQVKEEMIDNNSLEDDISKIKYSPTKTNLLYQIKIIDNILIIFNDNIISSFGYYDKKYNDNYHSYKLYYQAGGLFLIDNEGKKCIITNYGFGLQFSSYVCINEDDKEDDIITPIIESSKGDLIESYTKPDDTISDYLIKNNRLLKTIGVIIGLSMFLYYYKK